MRSLRDHLRVCPLVPLDPSATRPVLRPVSTLAEPHLQEHLATSTTRHKFNLCQLMGLCAPGLYPPLFPQGRRAVLLHGIGVSDAAAYKLLTTAVCENPVVIYMEYDIVMEDGRRVTLKEEDTIPKQVQASKYLRMVRNEDERTVTISFQPTVGKCGKLGFPRVLGPASVGRREHLDLGVVGQEVEGETGGGGDLPGVLPLNVEESGDGGADHEVPDAGGHQEAAGGCAGRQTGGLTGGGDDGGGDPPVRRGGGSGGGGGEGDPGAAATPTDGATLLESWREQTADWDPGDDGNDPSPGSFMHHLSVEGRRIWEAVLNPEQLGDDQIQEITKLTREQFFQLCRDTEEASQYSGRGPRLQLRHEARVLLFFLREVKSLSFRYIAGRFLTSRKVATTSFLDILFFIFLRHPSVPCLWNDPNLISTQMNNILESLTAALSPAKRDFVAKFRDARGRPVTFVTDDGTNILVTRSGDAGLAQVTDSGGRGGMNKGVCLLMAVTVNLDGTIVGIRPGPGISGGRRAG